MWKKIIIIIMNKNILVLKKSLCKINNMRNFNWINKIKKHRMYNKLRKIYINNKIKLYQGKFHKISHIDRHISKKKINIKNNQINPIL